MRKLFLSFLLSMTLFSNTVFANSIHSDYSAFDAKRLQSAFPHTLSKDGSLLIEEKLTATDYASILFALTNIQDNSPELKRKISDTFTGYILTSEFLFINPDGSVISAYDYKEGKYVPTGKTDISSLTQYSIAFHSALNNTEKFNTNPAYQKKVAAAAFKHAYNTSNYVWSHMYENGKFFEDAKKEKVDYKTMANGLLSYNVLFETEKNSKRKNQLAASSKEIYDTLNASWNEKYRVFDFNGDGSKVKFDLRDFGLFLWGTSELAEILAANGYGYEALTLMTRTEKMINTVLVDQATYKNEGIAREIEVIKGAAAASRDEINTGRLYTFLYGYTKWSEHPFAKVIGIQNKNLHFIRNMMMYGVKNHMDEFAVIHDTLFTNPSVRNDAKETPYLTWFMTTADYVVEAHKSHFSAEEIKQINHSIEKNYTFLIHNIYQSGKSINEKSGY